MLKRKFLIFLLITSILFTFLSGCGKTEPKSDETSNSSTSSSTTSSNTQEEKNSNKNVTIEFWNGHTGPDGEVMREIVKDFENTHPNIKINVVSMAWDQLFTKAELGLSQNNGPDLITFPADRIVEISDKIVKSIDDIVEEGNIDRDKFDNNLWELTFVNDKQYGIPLDTHPYVIFYNKKMFADKNISVPSNEPLTKEKFLSLSQELTDKSKGIYGFGFKSLGVHAWWDTWSFYAQYEEKPWDNDGSNVKLNSENMINTVTFLKSLQDTVFRSELTDWQTLYSLFVDNKIAMIIHGSWLIPALKKVNFDFGTMVVPQIFDNYNSFANEHIFGLTRINDERTKAAVEFIKWFETKDIALKWGKVSGNVPALLEAREEYQKDPLYAPIAKAAEINKSFLFMNPYLKQDTTVIYKFIQPALEEIYKDKNIDVRARLNKLNEEVSQYLKENK